MSGPLSESLIASTRMEIHPQLSGISSDRAVGLGPNKVLSPLDAIGIAIEQWHRDRFSGKPKAPDRAPFA